MKLNRISSKVKMDSYYKLHGYILLNVRFGTYEKIRSNIQGTLLTATFDYGMIRNELRDDIDDEASKRKSTKFDAT